MALPASCGRESCAVHVERASLLAEDAALKHAVRMIASVGFEFAGDSRFLVYLVFLRSRRPIGGQTAMAVGSKVYRACRR